MIPSERTYVVKPIRLFGKTTCAIVKREHDADHYVKLVEGDMFQVLYATRGLYAIEKASKTINNYTPFRIQLKKENDLWVIDG